MRELQRLEKKRAARLADGALLLQENVAVKLKFESRAISPPGRLSITSGQGQDAMEI
jgi:hypothetical protein